MQMFLGKIHPDLDYLGQGYFVVEGDQLNITDYESVVVTSPSYLLFIANDPSNVEYVNNKSLICKKSLLGSTLVWDLEKLDYVVRESKDKKILSIEIQEE